MAYFLPIVVDASTGQLQRLQSGDLISPTAILAGVDDLTVFVLDSGDFVESSLSFDASGGSGNATFGATVTINGNAGVVGGLTVGGSATVGVDFGVVGDSTLTGALDVTGDTTLTTLSTSGLATLDSLDVTNNAVIGGTLTVTSTSTFNDDVTVDGEVTADDYLLASGALIPRTLTTDLTIYVDTAGDDNTGTGEVGTPYATLNRAIEDVDQYVPAGNTITIQINRGQYTFTEAYTPVSSNGSALTIQGEILTVTTGHSVSNIDGSYSTDGSFSGLQYIDCDVDLTGKTNMAVGQFVRFSAAAGGTNPQALNGLHEITAWDGSTATVRVWSRLGVNALPSGSITVSVAVFQTVLRYNLSSGNAVNAVGFVDSGNLRNLIIAAADSSEFGAVNGVQATAGAIIRGTDLGVHGFQTLFRADGGKMRVSGALGSKAQNHGVNPFTFSDVNLGSGFFNGCGATAARVQSGSKLSMISNWVVGCGNTNCIHVEDGSFCTVASANLYYGDGSTVGLFADDVSDIDATGATVTGFTTVKSPATNPGNDESSIVGP